MLSLTLARSSALWRRRSSALLLAAALVAALSPLVSGPAGARVRGASAPAQGYWLVAADGGIFTYGDARFHGSTGHIRLNQPVVGMAPTPSGAGYWLVATDGGIFAFGEARFFGSTGSMRLNKPIVGMAATPSGRGYWLVATDGGIFAFGDAGFFGSTGSMRLNKPIVGMAATPSGKGYWMVASDGGIFAFGDARFLGSTGSIQLNRPIVGMSSTVTGNGYWMVANDGGVFSFGDASFLGSAVAAGAQDVVAMVPSPTGRGYWQMAASSQVFAFGDAQPLGASERLNQRVVGAAGLPLPGLGAPGQPQDPAPIPSPGPTPPSTATTPTTATMVPPAAKGRPNVIVVVMDDMRAQGIMDVPEVMPKTKQWLAAGGTTFAEGYATTPLCCPERATIWSGRLSHNHGVFNNNTPEGGGTAGTGDALDKDWIIPRYLKDAGYRTALVGKFITNWHFRYPIPHFDEYAAFQGGYVDTGFQVKNPGDIAPHGERGAYTTDYIRDKVVEYISAYEANDDQPWYMHVTPHAPHDNINEPFFQWPERHNDTPIPPFQPTPANTVEGIKAEKADKVPALRSKTIDPAKVQLYHDGMLRTLLAADEMIDTIMTTLQAKGELDNTLVIFTSDNGYSWGERGVDSKGWPYTESVQVPFLVRWPGVVPAGAVDMRPVGGEDILPTLLEAAQYTPPQLGHPLDGRSFLPTSPGKAHKYLEFGPGPGPSPDGYAGNHRGIPTWASMRTPTWQYIEYYESSDNATVMFREYYDLTADPWELQNLLADTNPVNDPDWASLSALLQKTRTCVGTTGETGCP